MYDSPLFWEHGLFLQPQHFQLAHRQQLAALLYRFIQRDGGGFTGAWAFPLDYPDAGQVSEYAYEALCWMTMRGVITGMADGTLNPHGTATRAQAAVMLQRFCELNK